MFSRVFLCSAGVCLGSSNNASARRGCALHSPKKKPAPPALSFSPAPDSIRLTAFGSFRNATPEVYGNGSLLKILHFVPLHSTEALLMLSWASHAAGVAETKSVGYVRLAAAGFGMLTLAAAWQVARGLSLTLPGLARLDLAAPAAAATLGGVCALAGAFGAVAVAPVRGPWT